MFFQKHFKNKASGKKRTIGFMAPLDHEEAEDRVNMKTFSCWGRVVVCPRVWTERWTSESPYIQALPLSVTLVTKALSPQAGDLPVMLLIPLTPSPKRFLQLWGLLIPPPPSPPPNPVFKDLYTLRKSV